MFFRCACKDFGAIATNQAQTRLVRKPEQKLGPDGCEQGRGHKRHTCPNTRQVSGGHVLGENARTYLKLAKANQNV